MAHFIAINAFKKNSREIESEIILALEGTKSEVVPLMKVDFDCLDLEFKPETYAVEYIGPLWGIKVNNISYESLSQMNQRFSVSYEVDGIAVEAIASNLSLEEEDFEACCTWFVEVISKSSSSEK